MTPLRCTLLFASIAMLVPLRARAQSAAQIAGRRVLLEQAEQSSASGDHRNALDLAERAAAIRMTPSVRLFIAREQETLGLLAPAFGNADQCVREAEHDTTVPNRDSVIAACRRIMGSIRPQVGYVTVRVPASHASDLRVMVGGTAIAADVYGIPYVVMPGTIRVEATATGASPFRQDVPVTVGASVTVDVALERRSEAIRESSAQTASSSPPSSSSTHAATPTRTAASSHGSVAPYVVAGAGLLILGASGLLWLLRNNAVSGCTVLAAQIECPDQASANRASNAYTFGLAANVAVVTGGVVLVGGIVWWLVGRLTQHSPAPVSADLAPTAGGMVFTLRGTL